MALPGVWDLTGARRDSDKSFTFACSSGVLVKCAEWGYKPWQEQGGQPLAEHHQACTRMARADYCGNGRWHTQPETQIDLFDEIGLNRSARDPSWRFEAAWAPDGATCIGKTRYGEPLSAIRKECPARFVPGPPKASGDEPCLLTSRGGSKPLLRNLSPVRK